MFKCSLCGALLQPGQNICGQCGAQIVPDRSMDQTQLRSAYPTQPYQQGGYYAPPPPPKKPVGLIIATTVAVLAAVVLAGMLIVPKLLGGASTSSPIPQVTETTVDTPQPQPPVEQPPMPVPPPPDPVDQEAPPTGAIFLNKDLAKLNNDSTNGFVYNVREEVYYRVFSPGEIFTIQAMGLNNTKSFLLECKASQTPKSWVHCYGGTTKGNVHIWVRKTI